MDTPPAGSVTLLVPVYNERENLAPLHAEIHAVMDGTGRPWELLLVDDGSDDGGAEVMARLAAEDPRVRILTLARRCGQTAALAAGFAAARGEVVVTLDADLQNDPADIPRLLEALGGHAAVIGRRERRHDSWRRRLSSRIANAVRNRLTGETVADTGCSLKAMRRDVLARLALTEGMHRFLPTLIKMQGGTVAELPVNHRPRQAGRSKYGIANRLFVGLGDLLMVRWMQARALPAVVASEKGQGLPAPDVRQQEVHS